MTHSFFNYPQQAIISDYNDVRSAIIEFYKDNKDIISIYENGSVSTPGISDLDLIFVLNDQINTAESGFNLSNMSSFAHDLFEDGTVMKMPLSVFKNILYLDNFNFHRLSGEELIVNNPTELDGKFIKLASIVDWVPERILKMTSVLNSKHINITYTLCLLHSFGYSLKYLDNILDAKEESQQVISETARLRGEWHQIGSLEEDLIRCLKKAIDIGYKRLFDYEEYLRNGNDYLVEDFNCDGDVELELYNNHFIRFTSQKVEDYQSISCMVSWNDKYYVILSDYFYPHFAILASQAGKLPERMLSKISPRQSIDPTIVNDTYRDNLLRKMSLAEKNAEFLRQNNLKTGLIKYGFHF